MAQASEEEEEVDFGQVNTNFELSLYNSSYFTISNNKKTAKYLSSSAWKTCFGNTLIKLKSSSSSSSGLSSSIKEIEWLIKIDLTSARNIMIGICKNDWNMNGSGVYTTANSYMYYCINGGKYSNAQCLSYAAGVTGSGSTVTVIFNVKNKTLSFILDNSSKYMDAFTGISDGDYRLAIDMYNVNDCISVVHEKIKYNHFLSSTLDSLTECNQSLKLSIDHFNQNQQNLMNIPFEQLIQTSQILSNLEKEKEKMEQYLQKMNEFEKNIKQLIDKNLKPNMNNWKQWNYSDCVKWILTLDGGIYGVYANALLKSFKENQITGEDLISMTKNDLLPFGVKVFKHRGALIDHFQILAKDGNHDGDDDDQAEHDGEGGGGGHTKDVVDVE